MKYSSAVAVMLLAIALTAGPNFHACAQGTALTLVPSALVPASGTFWSLQKLDAQPPWPFDPFPNLPVYSLGDGTFLVDDSSVDYNALQSQNAAAMNLQTGAQGSLQFSIPGVGSGCGLSLDLTVSNDVAVVMLNNTRQGQTYAVSSTEDLSSGNWTLETNVLGGAGTTTQVLIPMNQRTNLFFRASEYRDYHTNIIFLGLNQTNSIQTPPDTMGAVGPSHFVELLNGTSTAIAVYDKSGALVSETGMSNFFAVSVGGTNYPTGNMVDPRILFDDQSQRWVASAIQQVPGIAILAVSDGDSPTNLAGGWHKYLLPVGRGYGQPDYDTLGLDANGIYLSVLQLSGTNAGHTIMAIKKPEIYQGTNLSTRIEVTNDLTSWAIQPAVNFDDVPTNGYAWFVAKGAPTVSSTNYQGGAVMYRRLQWQGSNAVWADTNWVKAGDAGSDYQDYYEFSGTNFSSFPITGISAPQAGTMHGINLYSIGSRLMMATIHNGLLWTCQTVGLSGTNGTYTGDASGTNVDRSAIQWLAFEISSDNTTLTLADHGRVYDSAESNAWWYYFPSLAVNCPGDMVMGFSGSSATNYIGAFYSYRLANGAMLNEPRLFQPGTTNSTAYRWGDYSATTLDPTDEWGFWMVQEYATPSGIYHWGTVIANVRPIP